MEDANNKTGRTVMLRDALYVLEDLEKYRNLHPSVAVLLFFVSAGISVLAFFLMNDSVLWVGIDEQVALLLVAMSWVLIFPIWVLSFLVIMLVLDALRIKDVRTIARRRLSKLTLSQDELHELHDILASRNWRHGHIFTSVIGDLTEKQLEL